VNAYEKVLQEVEAAGVNVVAFPTSDWRYDRTAAQEAGLGREDLGMGGEYFCTFNPKYEKPTIEMFIPPWAPVSTQAGVLAHEFGHHIDHLLNPQDHDRTRGRVSEYRASWHAYEFLTALGVPITQHLRKVLNYSIIGRHGSADDLL
jgi:hypothetical protein